MTWTRVTDSEQAAPTLPAWLSRMIGQRGNFGLLLSTGDVLRITSIAALHESSTGVVLADVLLGQAGVPDGVDQAWQTKHYLGAPVPGAVMATINLAQVVIGIEFVVAEIAEATSGEALPTGDEVDPGSQLPEATNEALGRAVETTG